MNATSPVIVAAISEAPAWALVSLTMLDADLRERGAEELARWIAQRLDPTATTDRGSSAVRSDPWAQIHGSTV